MAKKKGTKKREAAQGDPLQAHIVRAQRDGKTIAKIAEEAGVSTKTVSEAKRGEFSAEAAAIASEEAPDNRKLRGLVTKIARLAIYFDELPLQAVAAKYGLPESDSVRIALSQIQRQAGQPAIIDDATLQAIEKREAREADLGFEKLTMIGVLNWKPFFWSPARDSFACRFMRSLVGSVSPFLEYEENELSTLSECFDKLLDPSPRCYDAVFGLYDTTYRRFRNLEFVGVPGFAVRLGAIAPSDSGATWDTLLSATEDRLHPFVLREEVGHLYYQGTCGFRPDALTVFTDGNAVAWAERFLQDCKGITLQGKCPVFVADTNTCVDVLSVLASCAGRASDFALVEAEAKEPSILPPMYRVGVAVRADAPRWRQLLESAIATQLIGNALPRTAQIYFDLFARMNASPIDIHWDWSSFPEESRVRFRECIERIATERGVANVQEFVPFPQEEWQLKPIT